MKKKLLDLRIAVVALGIFFSAPASATFTAVTSGNWSNALTWGGIAPTASVLNQDIIIPAGITVTLDADITFSGLLNVFIVNGVLTSTTSNGVIMTNGDLTGNGTVSINKISYMPLSISTFSGSLNVKHLSNSATSLGFTAIANISDTLELDAGTLLLNTNGNLTMLANSTVKVNNGALSLASGMFNSGNAYNVMYTGTSKNTGLELNTVTLQHLYLSMSNTNQMVSLTNNSIVNGNVNLSSGKLSLNGRKLTMKGDIIQSAGGKFASISSSDMAIEGSGAVTSTLMFDAGSVVHDLTINRTGSIIVKIGSTLNIAGKLNLIEGIFSIENGGTVFMSSGSAVHIEKGTLVPNTGSFIGTAAYDVEYIGGTDAVGGIELSGSGLNNVIVNYTTSTNKVTLINNTTLAGNLNMMKGKLDLNGKMLVLNGTLSQNPNAPFVGSTTSELDLNLISVTNDSLYFDNTSVNSQSLNKLKINTGGPTAIVLATKLFISNELAFVYGKIALANENLEMTPTATITGYSDTKYVITTTNGTGALAMNVVAGASYATFPIGLPDNYSPAYVQQSAAATSGNFTAKCSTLATSVVLKAVNRTWFVESSVATINASLKFGWAAAVEVNGFDRNNAYISHFTSGAWDVTAAASATAGANSTYELSRNGITSLSPFAVVENGQPLAINENTKADGILVFPNPSKDALNIRLMNSSGDCKYEITDLTGRLILENSTNNGVSTFDVSKLESGCYFIRVTNLSENKMVTKGFIKEK